jgi:hypothetical protein
MELSTHGDLASASPRVSGLVEATVGAGEACERQGVREGRLARGREAAGGRAGSKGARGARASHRTSRSGSASSGRTSWGAQTDVRCWGAHRRAQGAAATSRQPAPRLLLVLRRSTRSMMQSWWYTRSAQPFAWWLHSTRTSELVVVSFTSPQSSHRPCWEAISQQQRAAAKAPGGRQRRRIEDAVNARLSRDDKLTTTLTTRSLHLSRLSCARDQPYPPLPHVVAHVSGPSVASLAR